MKNLLLSFCIFFWSSNSSYAQLSTLIANFQSSYNTSAIDNYIDEAEDIIGSLKPEDVTKGKRILSLFKMFTNREQDMSIIDFNQATSDVGLNLSLVKNINKDLSLLCFKSGLYYSYLVFNRGKMGYRFKLKGLYQEHLKTATNSFDGGVVDRHCRIVTRTKIPYSYSLVSLTEIPPLF